MAVTACVMPTSTGLKRYYVADTSAELPTTSPAADGDIGYVKNIDTFMAFNGTSWSGGLSLTSTSYVPFESSAASMVRVAPASVLALSSWTALNGASGTELPDGSFYLGTAAAAADSIKAYVRTAAADPYSETFAMIPNMLKIDYCSHGAIFRESATGKLMTLTNFTGSISVDRWTGYTAYASTAINLLDIDCTPRWFRIRNSGATLYFDISAIGSNWVTIHSEAEGSFFTTRPDQIGFFVNANNATWGAATCVTYYKRA